RGEVKIAPRRPTADDADSQWLHASHSTPRYRLTTTPGSGGWAARSAGRGAGQRGRSIDEPADLEVVAAGGVNKQGVGVVSYRRHTQVGSVERLLDVAQIRDGDAVGPVVVVVVVGGDGLGGGLSCPYGRLGVGIARLLALVEEGGNRDRGEEAQDQHDHEHLDQRESVVADHCQSIGARPRATHPTIRV